MDSSGETLKKLGQLDFMEWMAHADCESAWEQKPLVHEGVNRYMVNLPESTVPKSRILRIEQQKDGESRILLNVLALLTI